MSITLLQSYIKIGKSFTILRLSHASTYSNLAVSGSCSSSSLTGDFGMFFKYLSVERSNKRLKHV